VFLREEKAAVEAYDFSILSDMGGMGGMGDVDLAPVNVSQQGSMAGSTAAAAKAVEGQALTRREERISVFVGVSASMLLLLGAMMAAVLIRSHTLRLSQLPHHTTTPVELGNSSMCTNITTDMNAATDATITAATTTTTTSATTTAPTHFPASVISPSPQQSGHESRYTAQRLKEGVLQRQGSLWDETKPGRALKTGLKGSAFSAVGPGLSEVYAGEQKRPHPMLPDGMSGGGTMLSLSPPTLNVRRVGGSGRDNSSSNNSSSGNRYGNRSGSGSGSRSDSGSRSGSGSGSRSGSGSGSAKQDSKAADSKAAPVDYFDGLFGPGSASPVSPVALGNVDIRWQAAAVAAAAAAATAASATTTAVVLPRHANWNSDTTHIMEHDLQGLMPGSVTSL
jgi:hypothetical protein